MRHIDTHTLTSNAGINMDEGCLVNGICHFNIYDFLGIRQSHPDTSPNIFLQDITLSATTFIGTVLVISLIFSAIMVILGGVQGNESMASSGKKGIGYSIIGFLLVIFAYAIVKLVQYIAAG